MRRILITSIVLIVAGCDVPQANRARISVEGVSPSIALELTDFEAGLSDGKSLITWRSPGGDASASDPFFQIRGLTLSEGAQDPVFLEVAFTWPGAHERPALRGCDCTGSIITHIDEVAQTASVAVDLMIPFKYDGECAAYCDFDWYSTDGGTFFVPPQPCDAGHCVEQVACPGQSTDPIPVQPDDAGGFMVEYHLCPNPGIVQRAAHVVAHATLARSMFGQ